VRAQRIASHLISVGTFGQDIGAMTPFVHALRERETINNLMEEILRRAADLQLYSHRRRGL